MTLFNHILPDELCDEINDIACTRRVNGDNKSNEIILLFGLNEKCSDVHDELLQWLFRCLDTISHKVFDGHQYTWNIISQIKDDNYQDEDDEETKKINTIMVAIHVTHDTLMTFNNDGITVPFKYVASKTLSPQEIMNCLVSEPIFIQKIGVNTVSCEVMMKWWKEMISTEQNYFDMAGEGYMTHPMWIKGNRGEWFTVLERSFNFGWLE